MDIQLFVSDLDGTLLTEHSQVAPETAQAIQRAQQAGIRWLTATGRSWDTAAPLLEQAGISCDFVLLNGAELRSAKGELLLDASLSTATARQAADILSKHGIGLEINTDQGDFTTDTQFCSAAPLPEDFWSRPLTVRKLFGFCWDAAKPTAARQALGALNGVSITSSAPWNIEITAHEARKARMVERAAQLYGIDLFRTFSPFPRDGKRCTTSAHIGGKSDRKQRQLWGRQGSPANFIRYMIQSCRR